MRATVDFPEARPPVSPMRSNRSALRSADDTPALHDPIDAGKGGDVGEGVAVDGDQVGPGPGLDDPRLTLPAEHLRGHGRRALDRLERRHAELDLPLELLGLVDV